MKNILIYCEGVAGSHDHDILSKIRGDLSIKPTIVPLGGKKGAGGFINIHSKQTQTVDFYLFFRDYDFDFEDKRNLSQTNQPAILSQDKLDNHKKVVGKWCISYRTTIENYLFNPKTFFDFLEKRNECEKYNLQNEADVKSFFDKIAKDRLFRIQGKAPLLFTYFLLLFLGLKRRNILFQIKHINFSFFIDF